MAACCPPGLGCNRSDPSGACALELCRAWASSLKAAAVACARWDALQAAGERERRFRRRAYERARDRALVAIALAPAPPRAARRGHGARRRGASPQLAGSQVRRSAALSPVPR